MRLLHIANDGRLEFTKDIIRVEEIPPYAILSHTWGEQEVLLNDVKSLGSLKDTDANKKDGWGKIRFCADRTMHDGLEHFWVDTCCIDKANNTELSEAINSMFRWYQSANKCYVFLSDVEGKLAEGDDKSSSRWKAEFRASRWFSRGWTLQELLAPRSVEFFSRDGSFLGDKQSLKQTIHEITRIPIKALTGSALSEFDVAERFTWAQSRQTTKEEDEAYCMLGIFGCHLPLIYGEGRERAFKRLRRETLEASEDTAIVSTNDTEIRNQAQKDSKFHEEKLSEIRSWLAAPDPSWNYHKAHKQRQAGTGIWLLESEKFKTWKENTASRLWLYGIPGCGKTILSSTIIDHLQEHSDDGSRRVTVYFYFDFQDAQKQDPELMLRSLLSQLLKHAGMVPQDLYALFSSSLDGQQQPLLYALLEVVPQLMRQFTHVYVVLDALDECTQRRELMDMLETINGWHLDIVHLLMTSRKERDIVISLESYLEEDETVCLQRDAVDNDISRYVRQRLQDDKSLAKWNKNAGIRQEIEAALMQGSRGMFRWAVCQLDTLARCRNLAMLRNSLATLPQTLDQTYDRILTGISKEDSAYAIRILQWLTFSIIPLSIEHVAEIVAIDVTREPAFDRHEVLIDPLEAMEICSSLVTITTDNGEEQIIALAHYSVKEYLASGRIKHGPAKQYSMQEVECHKAITAGCLAYLSESKQPASRNITEIPKLAWYSAKFWSTHLLRSGDEVEEVSRLAMGLLSRKNSAYLSWIRLCDPSDPRSRPNFGAQLETIATPLYYAVLLRLSTVTRLLLNEGADVNAQNEKYDSALYTASASGDEAIVKLLVDADANVNIPGGSYGNALQAASADGYNAVVRLLIDASADVNAQGGFFGHALEAASYHGHDTVVELLIDAGADLNAPGKRHHNALCAAFASRHEPTIKVLLERFADVDQDAQLNRAMHDAVNSPWCPLSLVSTLQRYGASLATADVNDTIPHHYCVECSHETIATHLINAGVPSDSGVRRRAWPGGSEKINPDTLDTVPTAFNAITIGLTPLHVAALIGDATMAEFFLKHGANPNAVSECGETPLHLALRTRCLGKKNQDDWHHQIVLRKKNTYPNVFPKIEKDFDTVIDALLADPRTSGTATDHEGNSPLHCVRYGEPGKVILIQKLLSQGADPSCVNLSKRSPLHLASRAGDTQSVTALLDVGAEVTAIDKRGLTALHFAVRSGDCETLIAILKTEEARAANLVALTDMHGWNVLHYAARYKDLEILSIILENEAANPIKLAASKDRRGQNVLHHLLSSPPAHLVETTFHATKAETVQLLLDNGANGSELDVSGFPPLARYIKDYASTIEMGIYTSLLAIKENASFVDSDGQTFGHLCATRFDFGIQVLRVLRENNVDLTKKDNDGRTVLHRATMCSHLDFASLDFLINVVGIHLDEEDVSGRTALQYATEAVRDSDFDRWEWGRRETTRQMLLEYHLKQPNNLVENHTEIS